MNSPHYGDRHKTNSNLFWNGQEWQEDVPSNFWDFNLKKDWVLLVVCLTLIGLGVTGLIAIN